MTLTIKQPGAVRYYKLYNITSRRRCHATPKINFYHLEIALFAISEIAICTKYFLLSTFLPLLSEKLQVRFSKKAGVIF